MAVVKISVTISAQDADPTIVGAILRHESAAVERRILTPWPTMRPGALSKVGEAMQAVFQGSFASIGPGQMQLRRAEQLESLGYVKARESQAERIGALLGEESSVEYVSGMVNYLSDELTAFQRFSSLTREQQQRLILIGYNRGLEGEQGLLAKIAEHGLEETIGLFTYHEETLDEYVRWTSGQ